MQNWQRTWFIMATFVASFCVGGIARAAIYYADSACNIHYGGSCTDMSPSVETFGSAASKNGLNIHFTGLPTVSAGMTVTLDPTGMDPSSAQWLGASAGELYAWVPGSSYPAAGQYSGEVVSGGGTVHPSPTAGFAEFVDPITWSLSSGEADSLNSTGQISLAWMTGNAGYWGGQSGLTDPTGITLEIADATSSGSTCDFCIFLPLLEWGNATDTGNGTATTTWTDRLGFIFGGATNTFPMCVADGWFNIFDTIASMTTSAIDEQTLLLTTNFGYNTSTYQLSATPTAATTDIDGFQELVDMVQLWFGMVAWSAFGIYVFHDIGSRRSQGAAGAD